MTREEAIVIIRKEYLCVDRDCDIDRSCGKCDLMMPSKEPILEAYKMAIKALEQEPKTGHWIDDNEEIDAQYGRHLYKCSECNEYADMFVGGAEDWWDIEKPNYCPNCGSRMVEPQERSDKK